MFFKLLMHLELKLGMPIWESFDWVCGTSTGAILALALGKSFVEIFFG